ncbi:MAG: putative DsbA family dithiol-disulfide isomerase [Flavobacteriaceae bacterium]|jgi:predicted DsbA family dithiol-disulfide isomerase
MKVEIWSDVVCPFCYIGKRRFEEALAKFGGKEEVEIEWKSFQLNPQTVSNPNISSHQNLANHKGISVEQATDMANQVTEMASNVGLSFDFDKAVVANTFNAHRLLHFSKAHGKQNELKERLLKAYFEKGENIDDKASLITIAEEVGLDKQAVQDFLNSDELAMEVKADIHEAQSLSIHGVPFFVFNRKYGISGAQPVEAFLQTLEKAMQHSPA